VRSLLGVHLLQSLRHRAEKGGDILDIRALRSEMHENSGVTRRCESLAVVVGA
jgi:hypothetical protein